jgi:DoxX-like family
MGGDEPWLTRLIGGSRCRSGGLITITSLAEALAAEVAPVQEKWFARLCLLKAVIFPALAIFWIGTGIISLTLGYPAGLELMRSTGAGALSAPAVVAGALADTAVGIGIALRPFTRAALYGALGLSLFYALAGSALRPDLWASRLGRSSKSCRSSCCISSRSRSWTNDDAE